MVICSVENCGRPHLATGLCSLHYSRWRYNHDKESGRARAKKYRLAHPERWREIKKRYRSTHREEIAGYDHRHYLAHRKENREYNQKWRLAHLTERREYQRRWTLEHRERTREYTRQRETFKAATINNLTISEAESLLAGACFFAQLGDCEGPLCIAHDIPVTKGGNTTRANVFCLCRRHNSWMRTRTLAELFQQLQLWRG